LGQTCLVPNRELSKTLVVPSIVDGVGTAVEPGLNTTAWPSSCTATHSDVDGHEIARTFEVGAPSDSVCAGAVVVGWKISASPSKPATTHSVADGHEIASGVCPGAIGTAWAVDGADGSKLTAWPDSSTATHSDASGQAIAVNEAPPVVST
jgi:hypothetical protein